MDTQGHAESFEQVLSKIRKSSIDVVVVGKTSSGKSLFINCLLGIDLMRSGIGHTTPSTVRIQATTETTSYYQFSGDNDKHYIDLRDKESLKRFHNFVDRNSYKASERNQCIDVYISEHQLKENCVISNKVAILDTPGIERRAFEITEIKDRILEADALTFVVDIVSWWDDKAIPELLKDKNFFVRPNLIVAINKCDQLLEEEPSRRENLKANIKEDLSGLVVFDGQTNEEVEESTFYISSKLIAKQNNPNSLKQTTEDEELLMEEFRKIEERLLATAQKNSEIKKEERICDALQRNRDNIKREEKRIVSEVEKVKELILEIRKQMEEWRGDIQRSVNKKFVETAYLKDLHQKESGQSKVLAFLEYCKEYGFDDIKKTIIRGLVNDAVSKFIDSILLEEVHRIDTINFKPFYYLLDPASFDSSSFDEKQVKVTKKNKLEQVEKSRRQVEEMLKEKCADKRRERDREFEELKKQKKEEKQRRSEEIARIKEDNDGYFKAAAAGVVGGTASTLMGVTAMLTLGPSALQYVSHAESLGADVKSAANAVTWICGKRKLKELENEINTTSHLQDAEKANKESVHKTKEKKRMEADRDLDKLERKETVNARRKVEEQVIKKEYRLKYKETMVAIYTSVMESVADELLMRLDETERNLDEIEKDYSEEDKADASMVWKVLRWVAQ